ncbi:EAL domain-containing protein [Anaerotignum lactatifermentans]|uniref:EAL domain-containing protein n=1 Tax=Anaerotignum lactatifermentans TaxID=160404 RepID=A0ABS2GA72_9FIRM|nr:EAL domain-containing protein [Anaerotignum lactatifermentans]MBM6829297.1 EAL domain-containing protein [Anaerotignum lactatifermentans]MBM6877463.1 EAL domain-containing protein [Anaerotignum lactatifermentans]MBM6950874.1 EAL domain-containing protein [Anaerotignum lactatifermentans]
MTENNQIKPISPALRHQFEELRERASKDALSGLLNRGTMETYIQQRLSSMKQGDVCALFIIDMDNFKQVNDTLGHQAGDEAIRRSARILSSLFRAKDIVGRLGGDEFIVFLSGQFSEKLVRKKAQEICEQMQMVLGGTPSVTLTASVGGYIASGSGLHFDNLYQSADLALYKAKKNGKNCFFIKYGATVSASAAEDHLPVNTISLSSLLEHMDSGVALVEMGEAPQLIYVSPSFCRILGADPQNYLLPQPLSSLVHPDDWVALEQALRDGVMKNISTEYTNRVSADGETWLWWHVRATKIDYNNPYPVLLVTATDISSFKENEQRLQAVNERLQSAFEQTTQGMWEVNLTSRTVTLFGYFHADDPSQVMQEPFPDFLITNGVVHPNSVPRFQEFAEDLLNGRTQGYGNFILQYQDTDCYGWAALSYRMLYDDAGRAVKAVGIIEKLPTEFAGQEPKTNLSLFFPAALSPYMISGLQANLTMDTVQEFWLEGKDLTAQAMEHNCSDLLRKGEEKIFRSDDKQALSRFFNKEQLIALYGQKEQWISLKYRRIDGGGNIRWVNHIIHLFQDPLTHDIYLFACLMQYDQRNHWETELGINPVYDQITGLYDRATTRAMIEFQIRKGGTYPCAMAMIQLGGMEQLYTEHGSAMNQLRHDLTVALSSALGPACIVGQYSRSQLLVFFPAMTSPEIIKQQLEDAFSFVRMALADKEDLRSMRFVAGIVCASMEKADYPAMVTQAIQLCQLWHNMASDTVTFSQENDDWGWNELQFSSKDDQVTLGRTEMDRPLSEPEKDVALQCVSAMLTSNSLESSIHSVLNYIGNYYQADRVYVLALAENRHVVTMPFEWTSPRKPSIQQAVSGMLVERFPILKRCLEERLPLFLTRSTPLSSRNASSTLNEWHFTVLPFLEKDVVIGFLCIENPKVHPMDAALFTTLIPYIVGEQNRFHTRIQIPGDASSVFLSEMPNLQAYMNVIYSLNSDSYSSLGAICLDIPNLSSINSTQGFEYGSKLLWYVSKTLADIFGHSFIFRTWDAEFVALCPDITRQVFLGRCTRLRSALQRRYPKDLRIGHSWSDGIFDGKTLVNEARAIMRCAPVEDTPKLRSALLQEGLENVADAVRLGRFTIFLQPKIHMITGELLGAEALVRGLDEAGNLITPDRFIGEMEKNGDIRALDLFVLNQTLSTMDRWRREGRPATRISVNFSRFTLFDPTVLASVLAIQSRYTQLPQDLLELEVTEHGINVESQSLSDIIDRFRELGIRFALDDFGSAYSNLSIFTNVKFDCVKLDRSLISQLADNPRGRMLVRDLVDICHSSNMLCVAEGVETQAQISILTDAGCACAQGFFFDRPMPVQQFEEKYLRPIQKDRGI